MPEDRDDKITNMRGRIEKVRTTIDDDSRDKRYRIHVQTRKRDGVTMPFTPTIVISIGDAELELDWNSLALFRIRIDEAKSIATGIYRDMENSVRDRKKKPDEND